MIGIRRALSEDTRLQTISLKGECYDLHLQRDLYYICNHGTYEIVACITSPLWEKMFGDEQI